MAMVTLNGVDLNYRLEGDGPETIVLVNGLADDLETWFEQVPDLLAAGYRVLRFDNRGIGKSSRPKGPYTTAQMAGDAKAPVVTLRTCRWIIRELLARRAAMGLHTHPQARRWWAGWCRSRRRAFHRRRH